VKVCRLILCGLLLCGCGRRAELEPCNVATLECQEDVYYAIVRLRGDGFDPFDGLPPIRTITAEQYRRELTGGQPPPPPDPQAKPKINPRDVALQWLGLIRPTTSAVQASIDERVQIVAAFYDPSRQRVTVIDRGQKRNDLWDTRLLAHELVHAFQDNEIDGASFDATTDGLFAARARVEGEAVLYESLAYAEMTQMSPESMELPTDYRNRIHARRAGMPQETSPFYAVSWFAYWFGADLLVHGWLQGGNAAVRALTQQPPRRSLDYVARHEQRAITAATALDCRVQAPDGFVLLPVDRFGAVQLYAFLTAAQLPEPEAWALAVDWRDDLWWVYFDEPAGQVLLSWRIRLASEAAAERVVEAAHVRPMLRAERVGRDALIVGSEEALADWSGADDCGR
jgi:hypothetical protein